MPATPGASSGAGRDGFKQGEEIALVVIQEGDELIDDVYRPSEDNCLCAPSGVAFAELLEGNLFFPCHVVLVVDTEEVVGGVK